MPAHVKIPAKPHELKLAHGKLGSPSVTDSAWEMFCTIISERKRKPHAKQALVRLMRESFKRAFYCKTIRRSRPVGDARAIETIDIYLDYQFHVRFFHSPQHLSITCVLGKRKMPAAHKVVRDQPAIPKSVRLHLAPAVETQVPAAFNRLPDIDFVNSTIKVRKPQRTHISAL